MATATRRGKVDPKIIVEMQETLDPQTGEFPSSAEIARMLAEQHGVSMTRAGVRQAAIAYRSRNGMGPAPGNEDRQLPPHWGEISNDLRNNDATMYACLRIARREKAKQNGGAAKLHPTELRAIAAFEKMLAKMGDRTVVAWDAEASHGRGGWVIRQAIDGEEIWYGVMAVRPRP